MKKGDKYDTSFLARDKKGVNKWARYGLTWEKTEVHYLKVLFKQGFGLAQLCMVLQRPASGVLGKLLQYRLIREVGLDFHRIAEDLQPDPLFNEESLKFIVTELSQLKGRIPCTQTQVQVQFDKDAVLTGLEFDYSNSPRVVEATMPTGGVVKPNSEPVALQNSETILGNDEWLGWKDACARAWANRLPPRGVNITIPPEELRKHVEKMARETPFSRADVEKAVNYAVQDAGMDFTNFTDFSWMEKHVLNASVDYLTYTIPKERPTPEHILKKMKDIINSLSPEGEAILTKCSQMGLTSLYREFDARNRHLAPFHLIPFKETTMNIPIKSIESKTFINGTDAAGFTDAQLFVMIKATENEIKDLNDIGHKPEKLVKQIEEKNDLLKKLVDYVDAR